MTLLDMEKAFDRVWHNVLRRKIFNYGFPIDIVKTISSFIDERVSFASSNKSFSSRFEFSAGVPQGSPLSPCLLEMFLTIFQYQKILKLRFTRTTPLYYRQ